MPSTIAEHCITRERHTTQCISCDPSVAHIHTIHCTFLDLWLRRTSSSIRDGAALPHRHTHTHRAAIFENTKTENSERMSNMEMVKKHRAGNLMCHFRQRYSATAVAYTMARLVYVCNLSAILCCRAQRTVRAQNAR